jgi:dephospho-CoA kinase
MKIVGVTGCIGAGKSTVCSKFAELGVPVFDSDKAGHKASEDPEIIFKVHQTFGDSVMVPEGDGFKPSRKALAKIVFSDKDALEKLSAIVRPAISKQWESFVSANTNSPYVVCESAVVSVEHGESAEADRIRVGGKECHIVIVVTADESTRIERATARDGSTEADVRARMSHQMNQDKMSEYADIEIENNGEMLQPQVLLAHQLIIDMLT